MQLLNTFLNSRTWTRHGLKIAYACSGLLLLAVIVSVTWKITTQSRIKAANYAEQSIAPIKKTAQYSYRVNDIVKANLFGDPTPAVIATVAPKTTLDLTLKGVLAASDNNMARAIIMSGRRSSKLYSIGESIQGAGASVKAINANEVLLNRNGAIESLPMTKLNNSDRGNNSIILYSDGSSDQISSTLGTRISRKRVKPGSTNRQPRNVRKPNISGLDRALKKMGEL